MNQCDREVITDVAIHVLETMVFASSEVTDMAAEADDASLLRAEIQYTGARNGGLSILAPKPLCCEWAVMMAGEDSSDLFADALGEVANVIGGNWLTRFFPAEEKIKLLPPVVKPIDATAWTEFGSMPNAVFLSVDDCPFMLSVNARD